MNDDVQYDYEKILIHFNNSLRDIQDDELSFINKVKKFFSYIRFRYVKYAFQRMFKGRDDTWSWSIDYAFFKMFIGTMKDLRKNIHVYPDRINDIFLNGTIEHDHDESKTIPMTYEMWDKELDIVINIAETIYECMNNLVLSDKNEEAMMNRLESLFFKWFGLHIHLLWG